MGSLVLNGGAIVPNQRFVITCTGLRPETRHYFTFNGTDKSAACRQVNKALGEPLISTATGQLIFDFHFEYNEGRPGSGYEDLKTQIDIAAGRTLTSSGSGSWGGSNSRTGPPVTFNVRIASEDTESFCTGQIRPKWTTDLFMGSYSGSGYSLAAIPEREQARVNAFLQGGWPAVEAWDRANPVTPDYG